MESEKLHSVLLVILLLLLGGNEIVKADSPRPNIVLILADDMGFSDLGCYGGEVDTPNIDRLAEGGLRFTRFYNAARCCPTRASLITGLYPHDTGIGYLNNLDLGKPGYRGSLNDECVTLAEALRHAGYRTFMAGKWHLSRNFQYDGPKDAWPLQRGFEKFYGTLIAAGSYWNPITLTDGNDEIQPSGDFYYTEALGEKAIEYIRSAGDEPFFLYLAFTAPHWPLHAREEVIQKYRGRFRAGYEELRQQRHRKLIELGIIDPRCELSPLDPDVPPWNELEHQEWQQTRMEAYAAAIDHVDQAIGRVVKELKRTHKLDNTVIFFLSDNGGDSVEHPNGLIGDTQQPWALLRYVPLYTRDGQPVLAGDIPGVPLGSDTTYGGYGRPWAHLSNAPFRLFKQYTHEGGISTPLIVHWPASIRDAGQLRHQLGHVVDIMPTCLEIAGADYPKQLDGKPRKSLDGVSLVPTLHNRSLPERTLYWEHHGHRAVRDDRWKLVASEGKPWSLYDTDSDRTETRDLAAQFPERVKQMAEKYERWTNETGVLPWDSLGITLVPPSDSTPITRTPEELQEYIDALRKNGIEPPFMKKAPTTDNIDGDSN